MRPGQRPASPARASAQANSAALFRLAAVGGGRTELPSCAQDIKSPQYCNITGCPITSQDVRCADHRRRSHAPRPRAERHLSVRPRNLRSDSAIAADVDVEKLVATYPDAAAQLRT